MTAALRRIALAFGFMTRLPVPRVETTPAEAAAAMAWFPLPGLAIGAIVTGAAWAVAPLDDWVAALAGLAAWIAVTGALHLDGLADVADAAGAAHRESARLRAVLADPHVGSFGVVAVTLQIAAKLVLLHAAIGHRAWLAVALAPCAARIAPIGWTLALPPLHAGLATRHAGGIGRRHLLSWLAALAAAAWFAPAMLAAPPIAAGWGLWLARRLGGVSGDGHGAGIELVETGLLAAILVVPGR